MIRTDLDENSALDQWDEDVQRAEDCVLGGAMAFPECIPNLLCNHGDFFRPRYGQVFRLLVERFNQGSPVQDPFGALRSAGLTDANHDKAWIANLMRHSLPAIAVSHSGLLRNASKQRKLQAVIARGNLANVYAEVDELIDEISAIRGSDSLRCTATESAQASLDRFIESLDNSTLPQLIPQYSALSGLEVGEGLITVLGAPPGKGKTALVMQAMFDALELDNHLIAVVANAEMSFDVLIRRELTRATGITSSAIRFGKLSAEERSQIKAAAGNLREKLERVESLADPCNLSNLLMLETHTPGLLIVDYVQKFAPMDKDARQGVNEVMAGLRILAKAGWAVIAISATTRAKDDKLTLSSLRESSEIEYNADSVYLLNDHGPVDGKEWLRNITLNHAKNRHGSMVDIELQFHAPRMEFTERPTVVLEASPFANDFKTLNPFQAAGGGFHG